MRRAALAFLLVASLAVADPCPKCRKEVERGWSYCPGCGQALEGLYKKELDAAVRAAEDRKAELMTALKKLKQTCELAGDGDRAKRVAEAIEKLEGMGLASAAPSEAGAYAGKPVDAYRVRIEKRAELAKRAGSGAEAEAAVDAGLRWLARHQGGGGGWASNGFDTRCVENRCTGRGYDEYDAGVTALAVLSFLGAGITPKSEVTWKDEVTGRQVVAGEVVRRGIDALVAMMDHEGCAGGRHGSKYMYNHAIATLALAEAFGMTGAEALRKPAQDAVDFLLDAQNPGKAWRYSKKCGDNDTSVTSWAVAALYAADLAGLANAKNGYAGAKAWLKEVTDEAWFKVGYTAKGTGKVVVQGKNEDWDGHESLTGAAMTARIRMEQMTNRDILDGGAKLLVCDLPQWREKKVDMYYWFHGTEALFCFDGANGKYWKAWTVALQDALVKSQENADGGCAVGSWDPDADRWGFEGGRVFTTAMGVLALETPYRDARSFEEIKEPKPKKK